MYNGDFHTTQLFTQALRQQEKANNLVTRMADRGSIDIERILSTTREIASNSPCFVEFLYGIMESWPVAAERLIRGQQGEGAIVMSPSRIVEIKSKTRRFHPPLLANATRLSITDSAYEPSLVHTLQDHEIDAIVGGKLSLYDMVRSKHFGARVTNKAKGIWEMMSYTPVSLQHLDPNKFRKIAQGYEDCAPVENKSMPPNSGTLAALIASRSPDWSLESMTTIQVADFGWSQSEAWTSPPIPMLSPLALALTWIHDKTDSLGNMFYYDAPKNNVENASESINRSGCGIKALKDDAKLLSSYSETRDLAPQRWGGSQIAARRAGAWTDSQEITLLVMKRMIAGVWPLIRHQGEATRAAFETVYSQSKRDVNTLTLCLDTRRWHRARTARAVYNAAGSCPEPIRYTHPSDATSQPRGKNQS